jgi:spermidine synthase
MPGLGTEIFCDADSEGTVLVFQAGPRRILAFGNEVEQSCVLLPDTARLEYVYTQAMFLAPLLVPAPRRALVLGLGGGSLVRALREYAPRCRVVAVEQRALVVQVARDWFFLPDDDAHLQVVVADAARYMAECPVAGGMIFADLYHADGMDTRQARRDFLEQCRNALSDGVLSANLWCSDLRILQEAGRVLREVFEERVLELHVQGGNVVFFAFSGPLPVLERKPFFAAAQALGLKLRIPLQRQARNLWRQNAEALRIGRYATRT